MRVNPRVFPVAAVALSFAALGVAVFADRFLTWLLVAIVLVGVGAGSAFRATRAGARRARLVAGAAFLGALASFSMYRVAVKMLASDAVFENIFGILRVLAAIPLVVAASGALVVLPRADRRARLALAVGVAGVATSFAFFLLDLRGIELPEALVRPVGVDAWADGGALVACAAAAWAAWAARAPTLVPAPPA